MSFLVMPSETESGDVMGGGSWAKEYSYKNPNTGKWEYTNSPRTYGDKGNMTYDEWMKSLGREPGSYGESAGNYLYNEWLKSVTPEGKGRMNGMGEYITGTKPNEATTSEASQLGESTSVSANEESLSTSEDKGTDYSWITAATEETMPEQEKTKEKSEVASEDYNTFGLDKSDKKSKYPNEMSEDEFNAMYEFALGMSGKGENTENGIWGSFETLPLKIPELTEELEKYEKSGNEKKAKAAREQLESAKKQLESLENFISNYKDIYSPKKDETKKDAELEKQYKKAKDRITDLYVQQSELEEKAVDAKDKILVGHEWAPDKEIYDEDPSEYEGWIDSDKIGYGPGNVYNYTGPDDDFAAKVNAANNAWDQVAIMEKNIADAEKVINEYEGTASTKTTKTKKDIMNDYAAGKINAYQAAVALTKSDDDTISFKYDDIVSDVDYDKFSGPVAGSRGDGTVGVDSFMSDVTGPDITAGEKEASPTDISKKITAEFTSLNEVKAELGKVDITKVTNEDEAKAANEKITALTKNAVEVANRDFVTIYKELVNSGIAAKDLASNPKVKELSQNAFEVGQDIYERASELEAKTNELGLTNLDKKYIKKNLDEISLKVGQLDAKNNKAVGTYYSPGSDMNETGIQPTGINLSKDEIKALAKYADDIQSTKDAGLAIMKSAAFNGAENVTGGKYVEEWKNAKALETGNFKEGAQEFVKDKGKLTWKDYFAAGAKGTLGTAVAILGGAVTAINPVLGILLMTVGTASATKAGLQITTDVVRSKSTNKEMMFGSGEGGKDVFRDIYNRSLESANFGDAKSVGTYTNLGGGALSIVAGLVELIENPVIGVAAIKNGVEEINKAGNGGLAGNLDTAVKNIYDLGVDISTFLDRNDLKPEALGLTKTLPTFIPNVKDKRIWNGDYTVYTDTENSTGPAVASEYGSAESSEELSEEEKEALDTTYSGAKEQAKNSNLATDYNAGMEKDVNEAVSDERVKGYIVKIYGSEPDYIRNAISKILAAHSEREW